MKKKTKKLIAFLMLSVMLLCSFSGCGTEKLSGPDQKEVAANEKSDKPKKESQEKKESEEDEYLDVDSAEDVDVDYSKYNEKKTSGKTTSEKKPSSKNEQNTADSTHSSNTDEDSQDEDSEEEIIITESSGEKDQYLTDPIPEGKPHPVEPEDTEINTDEEGTCYLRISCATILDCMSDLTPGKEGLVPDDGIIFPETAVTFYKGESVFDVLQRETRNNRIHMESSFTPKYNSAYVEGINNLYEFDCGKYSGWMYEVNGWYPNYGCSRYQVQDGDVIHWNFTCDLGRDLGQTWVE